MEDLRFPIGKFTWPKEVSPEEINLTIETIAALPGKLKKAVQGLDNEKLDTPYRPEGWTIRQVVHHLADSHMNAYFRFKLALTEDNPTIAPYKEASWAMLADSNMDPSVSLHLIENLHLRWVVVMQSMSSEDWERTYYHPQYDRTFILKQASQLYAWHSEHHLAHITKLTARMNWNTPALTS